MQSQATYNYKVVRQFAVMTVIWGIVGMLVGVIIAAQLVWPELNVHEFLSYGRLRPLHTNAVIFAFGGNALVTDAEHDSIPEQYQTVCRTVSHLVDLIEQGWRLVVSHGNGPQVGLLALQAALRGDAIADGQRYHVKQVMVKPGQKTALQIHHRRAEHWIRQHRHPRA